MIDKNRIMILTLLLTFSISFLSCSPQNKDQDETGDKTIENIQKDSANNLTELQKRANDLFKPVPAMMEAPEDNPFSEDKAELGKKLYYDPRISLSGVISCNTCHNMATYGADNIPSSLGHKFQTGGRNAPTVLNAGFHIAQFWEGRAADLEEQAKGPVLNPVEMGMPNPELVLKRLSSIPGYVDEFSSVYLNSKDPVSFDNYAKAIASFERTLTTPSRFDDYLEGDENALTDKEKTGLQTFMDKGCTSCHNGVAIGGNSYQKFGVVKTYKNQKDLGRFEVTGKESDKYVFKVPSLRNVTRTYPYFHDGGVWNIKEAVKIMGETQLGIELKDEETGDIVAFLESLTGEIPKDALKIPVLPPSSPDTPKPQL